MKIETVAAITVGAVITSLLFAQGTPASGSNEDLEWQMFGTSVARPADDSDDATGADDAAARPVALQGLAFIYNRRTGKVYRFFEQCGEEEDLQFGCFDDMPVLEGTMTTRVPSPQSMTGNIPRR